MLKTVVNFFTGNEEPQEPQRISHDAIQQQQQISRTQRVSTNSVNDFGSPRSARLINHSMMFDNSKLGQSQMNLQVGTQPNQNQTLLNSTQLAGNQSILSIITNANKEQLYVYCPTHTEFFITNICTRPECIEPLCPECIVAHSELHKTNHSLSNLENIQSVREQAQNQQEALLNELTEEKSKLLPSLTQQANECLQKNIECLNALRESVLTAVENHFNEIHTTLTGKYSETKSELEKLQEIFVQKIEYNSQLLAEINSPLYIKALIETLENPPSMDIERQGIQQIIQGINQNNTLSFEPTAQPIQELEQFLPGLYNLSIAPLEEIKIISKPASNVTTTGTLELQQKQDQQQSSGFQSSNQMTSIKQFQEIHSAQQISDQQHLQPSSANNNHSSYLLTPNVYQPSPSFSNFLSGQNLTEVPEQQEIIQQQKLQQQQYQKQQLQQQQQQQSKQLTLIQQQELEMEEQFKKQLQQPVIQQQSQDGQKDQRKNVFLEKNQYEVTRSQGSIPLSGNNNQIQKQQQFDLRKGEQLNKKENQNTYQQQSVSVPIIPSNINDLFFEKKGVNRFNGAVLQEESRKLYEIPNQRTQQTQQLPFSVSSGQNLKQDKLELSNITNSKVRGGLGENHQNRNDFISSFTEEELGVEPAGVANQFYTKGLFGNNEVLDNLTDKDNDIYGDNVVYVFVEGTKILHKVSFKDYKNSPKSAIHTDFLDIQFKIPSSHAVYTIHEKNNLTFVTGGVMYDKNKRKSIRDAYKLNEEKNKLEPIASMITGRSLHALAYYENMLIAVGGCSEYDESSAINSCEYYDIQKNEWFEMSNCQYKAAGIGLAVLNQRYLYKFGGKDDLLKPVNKIERLDLQGINSFTLQQQKRTSSTSVSKLWQEINFDLNLSLNTGLPFLPLVRALNDQEILICGGYMHSVKMDTGYIVSMKQNSSELHFSKIKQPLPAAIDFQYTQSFFSKQKLYTLMDAAKLSSDSDKIFLVFQGSNWSIE